MYIVWRSNIFHLKFKQPYYMFIYITFFTEWHGRLSSRGNIVDGGGAEVDNAFRGVTIYHVHPLKNVIFILLYRMSPLHKFNILF